jgi:hypothetical protein
MGRARFRFEPSTDVELVVDTLEQALEIIDEQDPYRNPARCMRRLRRLFDNSALRAAVRRIASAGSHTTGP